MNILANPQSSNDYNVEVLTDTTIFPDGTFQECHASTITELNPGEFIVAWFAGSHEGADDVGIWVSYFSRSEWRTPVEVATAIDSAGKRVPCWNPVLFKSNNNRLYLFYKAGLSPREWWGMVISSPDNGKNWTKPQKLPDGFLGPIKNKPIQLANGNIICPSSTESIDSQTWSAHIEIIDEALTTWQKINVESDSGVGVIQPTILVHPGGKLQILCRSRQNVIYEAWSEDNGLHWSRLNKTSIPNPNSGIDGVTLRKGVFFLVYNPLLQGKDWFYGRNVLNAALSSDGENWKDIYVLENEKDGEFSYPAVIQASDGSIHITYTSRRKNIRYVVLRIK